MCQKRTRVLCVDDSVDLTRATGKLINLQPDLEDVGALESADGLLDEVARRRPDVVLMDLTMPGEPPLEVLAQIVQQAPWCRVVVYSGHTDDETVDSAFRAGASAFARKGTDPMQVLAVIRRVAAGSCELGPRSARDGESGGA
jgi:two-component system, NarL family, response regulator DesR